MNLDLTKPIGVNAVTLLSMLDPKRIGELAIEAQTVIACTTSRYAQQAIVENAIRKALLEATANLAFT